MLPPSAPTTKKNADSILSGAANHFRARERLRKLAFAETAPAPKIPEQMPLGLSDAAEEEDAE